VGVVSVVGVGEENRLVHVFFQRRQAEAVPGGSAFGCGPDDLENQRVTRRQGGRNLAGNVVSCPDLVR